jgi:formimidoylglutamate deiminase
MTDLYSGGMTDLYSGGMTDLFFPRALVEGAWVRDARVATTAEGYISAVEVGAAAPDAERVAGIAVPGVPNLHSHAFQRAMAGLTERGSPAGDSFWSWRERMYAFVQRLEPPDIEAIAAQLYVELLRHGYTSVAEFHYLRNAADGGAYQDPVEMARRVLAAADVAGMGVTLLPVLYRTSDFGGAPPTPAQRRFVVSVEDLVGDILVLAAAAEDENTRVGMALHSLRAVPATELAIAVDTIQGLDPHAPIHVHVAEQVREVDACVAWSGARPVEWLLANAPVDARWCLIHATHVDQHEVEALAGCGAVAGLCPTTEANLGDGVFPLVEYQAAGGRWGVGSDSHVSVSPVAELRTLEYTQRLTRLERNVAAGGQRRSTGRALLEAAWSGGSAACGRALGRLAPGARADIVVLDPNHAALAGREGDDVLDSWIFSGEDTPVAHVMVGGRWVVRDGRHVRQDAVAAAYRQVARGLAGAVPHLSVEAGGG